MSIQIIAIYTFYPKKWACSKNNQRNHSNIISIGRSTMVSITSKNKSSGDLNSIELGSVSSLDKEKKFLENQNFAVIRNKEVTRNSENSIDYGF